MGEAQEHVEVSRWAAVPLRTVTSWEMAVGYCQVSGKRAELAPSHIDLSSPTNVPEALEDAFTCITSLTPPDSLRKEVPSGRALWMRVTRLRQVKSPLGNHLATVQSDARAGTQGKWERWVACLQATTMAV